ncbi:secreted protein Hcp [Pseudomonas aeruginosa VRFPA02]|nr:secreted protein Hcp [Pseudomonas aeruginosa VRFPA02]
MATPAYMSITGTKQGLITAGAFTEDSVGNTYQEGHEDQVMVQGFNHEVIIPRDPQSGQPTGQRVHKPVVITKVFDKASPLLLAALTSGERLTKVEIQWYRTSAAGTQEHYYTTVWRATEQVMWFPFPAGWSVISRLYLYLQSSPHRTILMPWGK